MIRKILATVAMGGAIAALAAAPAFAHECYNASRSAQGNASIAAHSPSYVTFDETAMEFLTGPDGPGLCPAGAQWLIDQLHAASAAGTVDFDPNVVISIRTVQAQGIDHSPSARAAANLSDGKGVDHLGENVALNDFVGANIGPAFGQCV